MKIVCETEALCFKVAYNIINTDCTIENYAECIEDSVLVIQMNYSLNQQYSWLAAVTK